MDELFTRPIIKDKNGYRRCQRRLLYRNPLHWSVVHRKEMILRFAKAIRDDQSMIVYRFAGEAVNQAGDAWPTEHQHVVPLGFEFTDDTVWLLGAFAAQKRDEGRFVSSRQGAIPSVYGYVAELSFSRIDLSLVRKQATISGCYREEKLPFVVTPDLEAMFDAPLEAIAWQKYGAA